MSAVGRVCARVHRTKQRCRVVLSARTATHLCSTFAPNASEAEDDGSMEPYVARTRICVGTASMAWHYLNATKANRFIRTKCEIGKEAEQKQNLSFYYYERDTQLSCLRDPFMQNV